jgi:hypothetical protein
MDFFFTVGFSNWKKERTRGISQLLSFHTFHRNLRFTLKSILKNLTNGVSQGGNLARIYFSITG